MSTHSCETNMCHLRSLRWYTFMVIFFRDVIDRLGNAEYLNQSDATAMCGPILKVAQPRIDL